MKIGNAKMNPEKIIELKESTVCHLCRLKRGFDSGDLQKYHVSNADETHFGFNMGNGKTIGMSGDQNDSLGRCNVLWGGYENSFSSQWWLNYQNRTYVYNIYEQEQKLSNSRHPRQHHCSIISYGFKGMNE